MTPEVKRQLGAQRAAVKHLLTHEMRLLGHTATSLARALGCSQGNVSKVLNGYHHSPLVLDALRELGVPEQYLFDPRRMDVAREDFNRRKVA